VHRLDDGERVGEVITGDPPAARGEVVVVGSAFAVDHGELHGRAADQLAEQVADQRCLAVAGQPLHDQPGHVREPDVHRRAVLVPTQ
jgi:hypothetical protein